MDKGLLMVFTGNGKGKTSAALGVALRAAGQGFKTLMIQFIKGSWHMGRGFVKVGAEKPDPEDVRLATEAWNAALEAMLSDKYDMVILDELNYTIHYGMLSVGTVMEGLARRPERLHVIVE